MCLMKDTILAMWAAISPLDKKDFMILIAGKILGIAAIFIWEHWLSKTKKTEANSTIDLLINLLLGRKL